MDITNLTPLRKYLILSVVVIICVLMSMILWQRYENRKLLEQVTLIKSAVETQASTIKDLKGSIEETTLRSKDLREAVDKINSSQASIVKGIKDLKERSDEVKKFLDTLVPPELNRMLQDYRSGKVGPSGSSTRVGTGVPGARSTKPGNN